MSNSSPPFFVVGVDRSGTTMLRLMINAHPLLTVPRESHFLPAVLDATGDQDVLNAEQLSRLVNVISAEPRFKSWKTTPDDLHMIANRLSSPTVLDFIREIFRHETGRDSVRWGDKTAEYVQQIEKLSSRIPGSQFIHIVRDGRDVNTSLKERGWRGITVWRRARYWATWVASAERIGTFIGPDRYLRICYEDLVLNPSQHLREICSFLQIPFAEEMLQSHQNARDQIADFELNAELHTKCERPPNESDVKRWKNESSLIQVFLFEAFAGRVMEQVGQERKFRGPLAGVAKLTCITVYLPIAASIETMAQAYRVLLPDWLRLHFRRQYRGKS